MACRYCVDKPALRNALRSVCENRRGACPALSCLEDGVAHGDSARMSLTTFVSNLGTDEVNTLFGVLSMEAAPSKPWTVRPTKGNGAAGTSAAGEGEGGNAGSVFFGMIARSDSNMEDLGTYAGAGVFNSVPTQPTEFHAGSMVSAFRDFRALQVALVVIAVACLEVDNALEGEQDIEGCLDRDAEVYVVQSRAQLMG